eukprot:scaffold519_cov331-Pavlova_lutheri.AAC.10
MASRASPRPSSPSSVRFFSEGPPYRLTSSESIPTCGIHRQVLRSVGRGPCGSQGRSSTVGGIVRAGSFSEGIGTNRGEGPQRDRWRDGCESTPIEGGPGLPPEATEKWSPKGLNFDVWSKNHATGDGCGVTVDPTLPAPSTWGAEKHERGPSLWTGERGMGQELGIEGEETGPGCPVPPVERKRTIESPEALGYDGLQKLPYWNSSTGSDLLRTRAAQ